MWVGEMETFEKLAWLSPVNGFVQLITVPSVGTAKSAPGLQAPWKSQMEPEANPAGEYSWTSTEMPAKSGNAVEGVNWIVSVRVGAAAKGSLGSLQGTPPIVELWWF